MIELFKVVLIFLFILFLLRKKLSIGYALLLGSFLFLLLYPVDLYKLPSTLLTGLTSHMSVNLFLSLTLIKSFEYLLRHVGVMQKMSETSHKFLNNRKISIISMPLIIGMLPSLGGAYLSAPMVDSATKNINIPREEKAFINYWYRHPWELILPLYPGIVLASALSGFSIRNLILLNIPVAVVFFVVGFFLSMKNLKSERGKVLKKDIHKKIHSFFPILSVLLLVLLFHIDLSISLLLNILFLCIWYRIGIRKSFEIIKYGFTLDVIVLVFGVIIFKEMLQFSGAVEGVAKAITNLEIPYLLVFILLPLLIGLITGISVGFVGSTFPLLIHLKSPFVYEISLAFVSGYAGVLLSPLHLCLILTKDYFKADMTGIYRKIIPATLIVFLFTLIEFVVLRYYI